MKIMKKLILKNKICSIKKGSPEADVLNKIKDEKIRNAVAEYVEWFKPIADELIMAMAEIKREYDNTYLNYNYKSSRDLDIYLYTKSERLSRALKLIDENPFIKYYPYKINL